MNHSINQSIKPTMFQSINQSNQPCFKILLATPVSIVPVAWRQLASFVRQLALWKYDRNGEKYYTYEHQRVSDG